MSARSLWVSGSAAARAANPARRTAFRISSSTWCSRERPRRSAEDIARSVDSVGGGLDAFTSKELVSFNTKVLDEHLPLALDILADLVLNPVFRQSDIEKEKSVILEEIKMEADQPEFVLHETFISNFWKGHGLGKPILGTKETVKKFGQETAV